MSVTILIAEDEGSIVEPARLYLTKEGAHYKLVGLAPQATTGQR
jgi:hypothetical protein